MAKVLLIQGAEKSEEDKIVLNRMEGQVCKQLKRRPPGEMSADDSWDDSVPFKSLQTLWCDFS